MQSMAHTLAKTYGAEGRASHMLLVLELRERRCEDVVYRIEAQDIGHALR